MSSAPVKAITPPAATSPVSAGAAATSPPPPPAAQTFSPPPGAPPAVAPHANPKVAELQVMFPTVDVAVIELVLETCGGSTDRSIEQLLSMTDENFKPDELESVRREEASQVDLDEEFARSLVMQDEQNRNDRSGRSQRGQYAQQPPPPPGELPYEPRVRRTRPPNQGQDGQWEPPARNEQRTFRDTENPPGMLALEDKVNRFAETAGQTFNSFLTRAKAKYSEFQEQQQQRQTENASVNARESNWGRDSQQHPQSQYGQQSQWSAPGGGRGGQGGRAPQGQGLWGDSASYDSRSDGYSRSESFSSESTTGAAAPAQSQARPVTRPSPGRWQPGDTYDDPLPPQPQAQRTLSGGQPGVAGRRSPGVGSPEKTTAGKIDPAKLGILPKKRVDLLSTSPSASTGGAAKPSSAQKGAAADDGEDDDVNPGLPAASSDLVNKIPPTPPATKDPKSPYKLEDSDDDLEYTKNPFDER